MERSDSDRTIVSETTQFKYLIKEVGERLAGHKNGTKMLEYFEAISYLDQLKSLNRPKNVDVIHLITELNAITNSGDTEPFLRSSQWEHKFDLTEDMKLVNHAKNETQEEPTTSESFPLDFITNDNFELVDSNSEANKSVEFINTLTVEFDDIISETNITDDSEATLVGQISNDLFQSTDTVVNKRKLPSDTPSPSKKIRENENLVCDFDNLNAKDLKAMIALQKEKSLDLFKQLEEIDMELSRHKASQDAETVKTCSHFSEDTSFMDELVHEVTTELNKLDGRLSE